MVTIVIPWFPHLPGHPHLRSEGASQRQPRQRLGARQLPRGAVRRAPQPADLQPGFSVEDLRVHLRGRWEQVGTGWNRLEQTFCGWKCLAASCWKIWPWFEYQLSVEVCSL